MIKKEWQAILKNKFFIVIIVALATIPALYNLIFLSSMWDPYGKISDLPVAVVNQDKSATINGKTVNLGNELVDELAKGKDLDYDFVSDQTAQKGLKNDKYYMQITIPSDFSENAGSLVSASPKQAVIHYQTSVGHNFIASKMSESAMTKLKAKVSENITKTYTKTIFENLTTLSDGVVKAADGSNQLVDGSGQLKNGSSQIATNLSKLASSSLTFKDGADTLNVGLGQYTAGVATLATGANDLSQAIRAYTAGAAQIADGNGQLNAKSTELANGVGQLSGQLTQVQELVDGSANLSQGLKDLSGKLTVDPSEVKALTDQLSQLNQGIKAYNQEVANGTLPEDITASMGTITTGVQTLQASQTKLRETAAYQNASPEDRATLEALLVKNDGTITQMGTAMLTLQKSLAVLQSSNQATVKKIADDSSQLIPVTQATIGQMSSGILTAQGYLNQAFVPGAEKISLGTKALNDKLTAGSSLLLSGVSQFGDATAKLAAGSQQLVSKNSQLTAGGAKLAAGANQLTQNSPQLLSGASQLASGAGQIADGSHQLSDGATSLTNGLDTLGNGAQTLASGLGEAKTKLAENHTGQTNAKKIAGPLKLTHVDKDNSPENGVGMTPYMMSVALFVGALATNMIISGSLSGAKPKNRWDYLLARLSINGLIAVGAALLVDLAVHILGLSANHELAMLGFTILVSFTFMMIVTLFNTWLGKPGAFLMLILLLLQLAASAGTYPLALTSTFFQKVNPWIPMTYAVTGFRQVISLTGDIGHQTLIMIVISAVALGLLALIGYKKQLKISYEK